MKMRKQEQGREEEETRKRQESLHFGVLCVQLEVGTEQQWPLALTCELLCWHHLLSCSPPAFSKLTSTYHHLPTHRALYCGTGILYSLLVVCSNMCH